MAIVMSSPSEKSLDSSKFLATSYCTGELAAGCDGVAPTFADERTKLGSGAALLFMLIAWSAAWRLLSLI